MQRKTKVKNHLIFFLEICQMAYPKTNHIELILTKFALKPSFELNDIQSKTIRELKFNLKIYCFFSLD
jgi:hypothetical protein